MQYSLLLSLLLLSGALWAQQPLTTAMVMCSDAAEVSVEAATCTGSANCRACKNCKYCGHCAKGGGSCGVCSSATPTRVQSLTRLPAARSAHETAPDDRVADQPYSEYYLQTLVVENTPTLNVRTGPGSGYDIIQRLRKGDYMTFLAMQDGWVKVRLEEGSVVGYVYSKYVAVL